MKKKILLTSICAALITAASVGSAFAYFSTYQYAAGGYTIHLGDYEEITEEFQNWTKKVKITNKANNPGEDTNEPVYVRFKAFAGSQYTLTYTGDLTNWVAGADGYYYYNGILSPGQSTTEIDVKIGGIPSKVNLKDPEQFNVVVAYECIAVKYDADGNPLAATAKDWEEFYSVDDGGNN